MGKDPGRGYDGGTTPATCAISNCRRLQHLLVWGRKSVHARDEEDQMEAVKAEAEQPVQLGHLILKWETAPSARTALLHKNEANVDHLRIWRSLGREHG
jgi:hypothetical protein